MLELHQKELKYWLEVGNTTSNRLLRRVANSNIMKTRRKINRFRSLTKS